MKLALHRSITFWSGLLLMVFVSWAWWLSTDSYSSVAVGTKQATSFCGGILLVKGASERKELYNWEYFPGVPEGMEGQWIPTTYLIRGAHRSPADYEERVKFNQWLWEGSPIYVFGKNRSALIAVGGWILFIPYWLIMLAMTILWSALLLGRARRRKRAAGKNPESAPS